MQNITILNDNPQTPTCCFPGWVTVLTKVGIKQLKDLTVNEYIWDGKTFVRVVNIYSKGIQDVHRFTTRKGDLFCTKDHKVHNGTKLVEASTARRLAICEGPVSPAETLSPQIIMDGLVIADGVSNTNLRRKQMYLHIGKNDFDYFTSEIKEYICTQTAPTHNPTEYSVLSTLTKLNATFEREVPTKYFYGTSQEKRSFLRGYFSGNGFNSTMLGVCSSSEKLIKQIQLMLNSLGITTTLSETQPKSQVWENGTYLSKKGYTIVVLRQHKELFLSTIGFIQKYKQDAQLEPYTRYTKTAKIIDTAYFSTEKVFDITVESDEHLFWCNGFTVSNCHGTLSQFFVRNDFLCLKTYQRSADILLGVPHNWVQYWALLKYFAYHTQTVVAELIWVFGDLHLYTEESHMKAANEILSTDPYSLQDNNLKMHYEYSGEMHLGCPKFKASDFTIEGTIPTPVVTTRPKLLA